MALPASREANQELTVTHGFVINSYWKGAHELIVKALWLAIRLLQN